MSDGKVTFDIRGDSSNIDKDMNEANKKFESGGKLTEGIMQGIGQTIAGVAIEAGKQVLELGMDFEESMAKVSTMLTEVDVDSKQLNADMLSLSNSTGVASSELSGALYTALSAGVPATEDMSEAMDFLEQNTKLAKGGFTDLDTAVDATTSILNAYGKDVSETDQIHKILMQTQNKGKTTVDELAGAIAGVTPTAAAMGVEFDEVGASLATMTAKGTPTSQAVTQLNSLIAELGKEGTQASTALMEATEGTEYAGMGFTELMESGMPLNEILMLMEDYATENNVSMLDLFGSLEAGKAALSLAGEGAEVYTENLEAMRTETDVVTEASEIMGDTTAAKVEKAKVQMENFAIMLFEALAPVLELIMTLFEPIFEILGAILGPVIDLMESAFGPLIEILVELIGKALEPLMPLIEFLADLIGGVLGSAIDNIMPVIENLMGIFTNLIDFISNVFSGNWEDAWDNIVGIFSNIIEGIANIFKAPINWIIDGINKFLSGIGEIKIPDWVPFVGGKSFSIPLIPKLAEGGLAFDETMAVVGDNPNAQADPEVIAPLSKLQSMLDLDANVSKSNVFELKMTGEVNMDGFEVGKVVLRNLDDVNQFS